MSADLMLRRKWTIRAHGRQVVFVKSRGERTSHVVMKALLWALYLPEYADLTVELSIGARYKPDVVALDACGQPVFWAEAGKVSSKKLRSLLRRYPATHFAFAKWNSHLDPLAATVASSLCGQARTAPVDLIAFPADSATRFFDDQGQICLSFSDLAWTRLH
jgi:hypothetical protein